MFHRDANTKSHQSKFPHYTASWRAWVSLLEKMTEDFKERTHFWPGKSGLVGKEGETLEQNLKSRLMVSLERSQRYGADSWSEINFDYS